MKIYKLTPPFSNLSPLFRSFLSFSHLLYMKMYTGRMASAVGTKRDSSSEDWVSVQYQPQSRIHVQTTNLVNFGLRRFNCNVTGDHHTIGRRCTRCRKVIRQSWIPIRIHAIPEPASPLWWVSFFHSVSNPYLPPAIKWNTKSECLEVGFDNLADSARFEIAKCRVFGS